jgi:hypothetical protein
MTRPESLGHAVHQHYTSQTGDGRTRANQDSRWGSLDNLRALAAQADADPAIAAMLSPQQKHAIGQLKLTDAHRAQQAADNGDDAA